MAHDWPADLLTAWRETWDSLGQDAPMGLVHDLLRRWSEPARHYHDLEHLADCLSLAREVADACSDEMAVALALWFHDAIYDPRARDNEEQSASLAVTLLEPTGLSAPRVDRIVRHIRATRTHESDDDPDTALLLDIDLSILGASPERFARYEREIRAEYAWVEERRYVETRRGILEGFLARKRIFLTPALHDRFEAQARENLRRAIQAS